MIGYTVDRLVCVASPSRAEKSLTTNFPPTAGGILPVNLVNSADPNSLVNKLITTNTKSFPGPNFNFTMGQQGLTANTSCQYSQLNGTTNPPLERFANPVEITVGDEVRTYTSVGIVSTCNGQRLQAGEILTKLRFVSSSTISSSFIHPYRCADDHEQHTVIEFMSKH